MGRAALKELYDDAAWCHKECCRFNEAINCHIHFRAGRRVIRKKLLVGLSLESMRQVLSVPPAALEAQASEGGSA